MKATGIICEKRDGKLQPVSAFDAELLDAMPDRTQVSVAKVRGRSNPQNRMYWSALGNVVASTKLGETYPTSAKLHDALLRSLGFVTITYDLDGNPYVTRDSTRFDAMGPDEFREYLDRALAKLAETIGCDPLALTSQTEAA